MKNAVKNNNEFLLVQGEMAQLTRRKDWSKTPVGPMENWQQSLRTLVGIILNSKSPMFLWWGPELICFYNDAYRPSLGENGKHPSILGMPAEKAWPEIWPIIKPLIDQVLSGGATWSEDQLIPIFRNGRIEDVYWTFGYSPVNDDNGCIAGVLVICNETTEKVNAVKSLEESNKQLAFALEAAELGTFDYNPNTNKFTSNQRLKDWFGLPQAEQLDVTDAINAIAETDRERVSEAIQRSMDYSTGGKYEIDYTIIHPVSKKEIVVHAKGQASFDEHNIAYRLNGTLQDITEQKLFQRELEKQVLERTKQLEANNVELAKINKELQSFAYISSHDLQEPLRKIQTFVSRIIGSENEHLSERGKDLFMRMQKSAERMQSLIDDLLAYSRTHTLERNFKRVNIATVIEKVEHDLEEEIQKINGTIITGEMCEVNIIPFQFQQLFLNLISNSIKFSNPQKPLQATINAEHVKGSEISNLNLNNNTTYCHITVADNGIGFESQYNEQIFELFQRLHNKNEYRGTGVGLAIVKRIVENHNGTITASGAEGRGATFNIYIP